MARHGDKGGGVNLLPILRVVGLAVASALAGGGAAYQMAPAPQPLPCPVCPACPAVPEAPAPNPVSPAVGEEG